MKIFRANFFPGRDANGTSILIPIGYRSYKEIRAAYYGGHVDVYRPLIDKAYYDDVNSLYPAAMLKDMPTGIPRLTFRNTPDFFGFALY